MSCMLHTAKIEAPIVIQVVKNGPERFVVAESLYLRVEGMLAPSTVGLRLILYRFRFKL